MLKTSKFNWYKSHFDQATRSYVGQVRTNIGNSAFASLFDLGNSSALAVLVDTSGSMGNEIEAVKAQVIEIIDVSFSAFIMGSLSLHNKLFIQTLIN